MARSELRAVKTALASALARTAKGSGAPLLAPLWQEAVGPQLAAHSRLCSLLGGVLLAEVDVRFVDELQGSRELIRDRLNAALGRKAIYRVDLVAARIGK